jgi:hypothetical protein
MTMGAPQLTESRKVKRPGPCTIGHALSTICADSRSVSANAFASADSVAGVWVTNLGAAGGSGRCQQDRWRVVVGLGWQRPGAGGACEQRRPRPCAFVSTARAHDEAPVLCEDPWLDGLDVRIELLVAKIESGLQALEDVAQFGGLKP